ncbi:MAG: hypothetical protein RLZZ455_487 [Candidatus Parcubacteria bacterium]|jgi:4-amino-4-deoxy-L-arabinose transferase-like glycosyltransferase
MLGLFKKESFITSRASILIFAGILLLGVFLRFNLLSSIPNGLQQDETSIGYNAYSIVQTGRDEYGQGYPVLFKAFGEYKLPGYIYLSTLPVWIFGPNAFAVRFVSAFFGSISIVILYLLLREMIGKKDMVLPLVASFLLAVNPWHLHFSRGAFEVTPALFFILSGVYLYFVSLRKKSIALFLFSIFIGSLSLYTYNIARVFTPLLYIGMFLLYRPDQFVRSVRQKILVSSLLVVLCGIFLLHVMQSGGYSSTRGTLLFTSAEVQSRILEFRSYLVVLPPIFTKLFFNSFVLSLFQYMQNILSYFSMSFLFLTGSTHGNHGIGNVGQMYSIELLFFCVGLIVSFKARVKYFIFFLLWAVFVILVAATTREAPHATRGFFLIVPLVVFSATGCIAVIRFFVTQKRRSIRYGGIIVISIFFIFNMLYYFVSYYNRFPVFYAPQWRSEDAALADYLKANESKYVEILIDKDTDLIYSSLLYHLPFPPKDFQETVKRLPDDSEGFSKVESFGKYRYKAIDWEKDMSKPHTLIITSKADSRSLPILERFYYPQRPVVVANGQEIVSFPITDQAYVVLETTP